MKKIHYVLFSFLLTFYSFAQGEMVKFQADIANRNGDVLYIKQGRAVVKEVPVGSDGVFNTSFEAKEGLYQMFDGKEYAQLYLKNGYDLKLKMDAANFDASLKFTGKGEAENNYLASYMLENGNFDYDALLNSNPEEFLKMVEAKKSGDLAKLEAAKLESAFVAMQKQNIEGGLAGLTQYYNQKQEMAKMNGMQSPSFEYENYAGGKTKLEDLRGKYVYIDVWATWCGPCRQEIPFLKQMEEKYHDKKIAFVSISTDQIKNHDKWKKFVEEKELKGIQLITENDFNSDFIKAYKINSIPRFILLDPKGMIISADADRPSNPKLQEQLDQLLN